MKELFNLAFNGANVGDIIMAGVRRLSQEYARLNDYPTDEPIYWAAIKRNDHEWYVRVLFDEATPDEIAERGYLVDVPAVAKLLTTCDDGALIFYNTRF